MELATVTDTRAKLLELGQAVARAATIDDMMRVVAEVVGPLVKATNATAMLLDESHTKLVVYHGPAAQTQTVRMVDLTDPTPAAHAARTGESVFLATPEEMAAGFPRFVEQVQRLDWAALAVVPLREAAELCGVVVYRWSDEFDFTPTRRELIEEITELVGHALVRARDHDRLLAHARRLRDSNRDLDSFAAAVAHDLRQPLRQISAYLDVLLEHLDVPADDPVATRYADRMRTAVGRADRLIVALLDYARAGGKPMTDAEVDLGTVTHEVLETLRTRLDEVGAQVRVGDLPIVEGDAALCSQVLQNLIDNAAKYHDPARPAEIVVSAEQATELGDDGSPWWRITVADNGIGIPDEQRAKVFDVFTQAQQGTQLSGTGIGLATAKRVVERHGGTIGVDSTPGRGSTFWFTLPGVAGRHRY